MIRAAAPARRWLALGTLLLLAIVALYVAFELGRYLAGYDAVRAAGQRGALQREITRLQQDERALRFQLASGQEAQVADVHERAAVARTIGELQAQLERAQRDVEFYRGLLAPQLVEQRGTGIRVQMFHITALPVAQQFMLRFTLSRAMQPERASDGTLIITVDGMQGAGSSGVGAGSSNVDLATLTGGARRELPFNFRYYSNIEQLITLPIAFKPDSVTIDIWPGGKGVAPYRQTFIWEVDPI